eukprot:gene7341-8161_t
MAIASGYSAFKRWSSSAISAILEQPPRNNPSLVSYAKYKLPVKYKYKRPDFMELDEEATLASADHEIRPVMRPKRSLALDAGYAEAINAGKTHKVNEDQSVVKSFTIKVPPEYREEDWGPEKYTIPCVYFAVFDGHAGTGAGLMASNLLHKVVEAKLTEVSHMLVLDKEDLKRSYLNYGLIQDVTAENLVIGSLEESFIEMDEQIKQEHYDFAIDGGCTALVGLFILGKLFVANAGDSRAVLYKDFEAHAMSFDHTPETERQRIQLMALQKPALLGDEFTRLQFQHRPRKKHFGTKQLYRDYHMSGWALKVVDRKDLKPQLVSGEGKRARLLDTIGVTRGLGDHDLEFAYCPGIKIKPFMLPNPEVRIYDLEGKDFTENDVLVMATDGLWERFNDSDVIEILKEKYIVAAQALVDEARGTLGERGWRTRKGEAASYDDISVFVIPLRRHSFVNQHSTVERETSDFEAKHAGRQDSFVKRYVDRDEVEISLGKKKSSQINGDREMEKEKSTENSADSQNSKTENGN